MAVGSAGINKVVLDLALAVRVPAAFITINTQSRTSKLPYIPVSHFLTGLGITERTRGLAVISRINSVA